MPRERCGPGADYETEAEVAAWWERNKHKRWNPEMGRYEHAIEEPDLAATPPVVRVDEVVPVVPPPPGAAVPSCREAALAL